MDLSDIPHEVVIDMERRNVLIDGQPFPYLLADRLPEVDMDAHSIGVVWLPLIADKVTYLPGVRMDASPCPSPARSA